MRVLGLDPGTLIMGFGVIERNGREPRVLDYGCLRLSSKEAFPLRLKKIYDEVVRLVEHFLPDEFAIESLFYAKNPKVAIKMGHARGVAIVAAVNHQIPAVEYTPREIKQAIVGNGAASKEQVQRMLCHLLHLRQVPEPLDASDALAVALCHMHRVESKI
ncbi:MAG: crossover junction endodeoxyribonuclease RuvC [bacterium]